MNGVGIPLMNSTQLLLFVCCRSLWLQREKLGRKKEKKEERKRRSNVIETEVVIKIRIGTETDIGTGIETEIGTGGKTLGMILVIGAFKMIYLLCSFGLRGLTV